MIPVPTAPMFRRDADMAVGDALSPPREARATDITKATVPMPFMLTIIGLVVTIVIAVLSIKSDVRLIDERLNHEKELRVETERRRDEQFKVLEAKVESAGLRNFNMSVLADLQKAQEKLKGR